MLCEADMTASTFNENKWANRLFQYYYYHFFSNLASALIWNVALFFSGNIPRNLKGTQERSLFVELFLTSYEFASSSKLVWSVVWMLCVFISH